MLQKIATGNTGLDRVMLDWLDNLRALGEGPDPVGVYRMVFNYLLKVGETTEADLLYQPFQLPDLSPPSSRIAERHGSKATMMRISDGPQDRAGVLCGLWMFDAVSLSTIGRPGVGPGCEGNVFTARQHPFRLCASSSSYELGDRFWTPTTRSSSSRS